jgi:RNA polymerase sigma-70 factor, ECF subfamily
MTADENLLVQRARAGDSQAFGDLVLMHQTFAYNLALRAVGDPHEAQDLAQEAFLRAWQGLAAFRGAASFRTWLYRIVMNLCYNRAPQLKRELAQISLEDIQETIAGGGERPVVSAASVLVGVASPGQNAASPEREVEAGELRVFLHRQIEALPPSYRLLVLLRYQQDLSYEEIAEVMGMPLGSVKTGLFRAHTRLKDALSAAENRHRSIGPMTAEVNLAREETLYG